MATSVLEAAPARLAPRTLGAVPRDELAIHLLAQLPSSARLVLAEPLSRRLALTAEAYGVADRVRVERGGEGIQFETAGGSVALDELLPASYAELCDRLGDCGASPIDSRGDEVLAGSRVVIVTNYPAHYRLPLFEAISRRLEGADARFSVLFLAEGERDRPWLTEATSSFEHEYLSSVRLPIRARAPRVPLRLERHLRELRPTIVLVAGFSPFVARRVVRVARRVGSSVGVWSGETAAMPSARSSARRRNRVRLAADVDFGIAYGFGATSYLRGLSRDLPIVIGRNAAPVSPSAPRERSPGAAFEMVLIGDLANARKGCDVAIDALAQLPGERLRLSIIGGGQLAAELAEKASADERIQFLGPLSSDEVARRLAGADALLFPTRSDVFGLALVEAMGAGLVSLVSTAAGAVDDLVVDQQNSIVIRDHAPESWAAAIRHCATDRARAERLGNRAFQTVEARWTMAHAVDAMLAGLRLGMLAPPSRTDAR